jgi:Cof subfamily protein (haloacid dehalogenase superfamily)
MSSEISKPIIKVIVTDIDGTLLNSAHELSERNLNALKAAAAQGIKIILATGKTPGSAAGIVEKLGIPIYGIYLQGLLLMNTDGSIYSQQTLHPDTARQAITYADERGFSLIAFSGSKTLAREITQLTRDYTIPYHEPLPELVGPLQNILWTTPIHKIIAIGEPRAITALRWQLNTQMGGKARLVQAGIPNMMEILPPGGGKGPALKTLLKELHIAAEHVLALGDAENDIEMLQLAGVGVAVGNADEKTKAAANHVVGSNDADGVAEAIERFALPEPAPASSAAAEAQIAEPSS